MSTTPRTDAKCIQIYEEDVTGCSGAIDYVPASVARQLERELAAAIARAEKAEADCERFRLHTLKQDAERAYIRADNLAAHRMACEAGIERDQLRVELEAMKSDFGNVFLLAVERGDRNVQLQRRAEKAEAELKQVDETAKAMIQISEDRIVELERDKVRLDWLLARNVYSTVYYSGPNCGSVSAINYPSRAAVDAAMKEDSK